MGFDEEWARAKAAAVEQAAGTRLNGLDDLGGPVGPSSPLGPSSPMVPGTPVAPGGTAVPGGSSADLTVHQDDLGAVGNEAHDLFERFNVDGDVARESSQRAASTLKGNGFTLGSALSLTAEVWNGQRKTLLQACAHISNHLNYTRRRHNEDEARIAATMRQRDGSAMPVPHILDQFT